MPAIRIYRVVHQKYAEEAYFGKGGLYADSRWARRGRLVVYASENLALAALEKIAGAGQLSRLYFSPAGIVRDLVRAEALVEKRELPVRTMIISEIVEDGHLAFQLDQYVRLSDRKPVVPSPSGAGPGLAFVRSGTFRWDSLATLSSDPSVLEMSDLVVVHRPRESDKWEPLVGDEILPTDQLALKFEVYHLLFGDDDLAHVQVDYRIERSLPQPLLSRLVRRNQEDAVIGSVRERVSTRTAEQFLELDFGTVNANEKMDIAVTVTDLVTGASTSRMQSLAITSRPQP